MRITSLKLNDSFFNVIKFKEALFYERWLEFAQKNYKQLSIGMALQFWIFCEVFPRKWCTYDPS